MPGQAYLFSQPIEMRFNEILEGTRADIAVKVFGDDYTEIERIAMEVRGILEKVPGAADVEFDALGKAPPRGGSSRGAMRWRNIMRIRPRSMPPSRVRWPAARLGASRWQPSLSHHRASAGGSAQEDRRDEEYPPCAPPMED